MFPNIIYYLDYFGSKVVLYSDSTGHAAVSQCRFITMFYLYFVCNAFSDINPIFKCVQTLFRWGSIW